MFALKPKFYNKELAFFDKQQNIPNSVYETINSQLQNLSRDTPLVSIVIAAWNEEVNIIKCVDSLSKQETDTSFEIIVVDNNSDDETKVTLENLNVKYLFQRIQGCGPARQLGQENAFGKYILLADADCIYPPLWVEMMTKELMKDGVACVYGNYSFMTDSYSQKIGMIIYELMRNIISRIRHFNRPFVNCLGMSMGYVKEYGLEIGYIDRNIRGDDGRLAYSLMKYGKIKRVFHRKTTVWTGYRTLVRKGTLANAFYSRLKNEFKNIKNYFHEIEDHDPKSTMSENNPSAHLAKKNNAS